MKKVDPEQINDLRKDIDTVINIYGDVLNNEPRILNPLKEASDAAKTKYNDIKENR